MVFNSKLDSQSNLSLFGSNLLLGSIIMSLIFMVDWNQESINSVYHYLLGAILFAVFSFIAKKLLARFSKKKWKNQEGK